MCSTGRTFEYKNEEEIQKSREYIQKNVFKLKNGCWMWLGKAREDGYGSAQCCGYRCKAHQLSFLVFKGDIPVNQVIRHAGCPSKNNLCVNPDHLELGSVRENGIDKIKDKTMKRGENHPSKKLTESQVVEIYKLRINNDYTAQIVANLFDTSRPNVLSIWNRKTWAHLHYSDSELKVGNIHRLDAYKKTQENTLKRQSIGFTKEEYYDFFNRVLQNATIKNHPDHKTPCLIPSVRPSLGYIRMRIGGVTRYAHVIMWELFFNNCKLKPKTDENGNILHVRHLCNNRSCCNIYHLKLGTVQENSVDGLLQPSNRAKLNVEQIQYIRKTKEEEVQDLAKKFQVTTDHIRKIINNKCWKFVTI